MSADIDTVMGGSRGYFQTTVWTLVKQAAQQTSEAKNAALNFLIERYWKPVYCFIRAKGEQNEKAKDLTQDFFVWWLLEKQAHKKADPAIGRFRSFLLSSLKNFLINVHKYEHAKLRYPKEGIISIHELAQIYDIALEPVEDETPEDRFNRIWIADQLSRVSEALKQQFCETDKKVHYELFEKRIIKPALDGADIPPLDMLAQKYNLTEKEASNRIITARRAYQRLLREEIRLYANSEEEVAAEIRDLFDYLSRK